MSILSTFIFVVVFNIFLHFAFWVLSTDYIFESGGDDGLGAKFLFFFIVFVVNVLGFAAYYYILHMQFELNEMVFSYYALSSIVLLMHLIANISDDIGDVFFQRTKTSNAVAAGLLSVIAMVAWVRYFL